jgi:predicted alpha-1,2-mannosidase
MQRNEVVGNSPVTRIYAGDGQPAGFSGYFVVASDHAFQVVKDKASSLMQTRILFRDVVPGVPVIVKIGSSFVSVEEARHNLESEIPNWDFDAVEKQSKQVWEDALGRIEIREDSPDRKTFYTALYHSLLAPRTYSDVSGTYPEFAGNQRTQHADGYVYYSDYSIWDTFRALHPLLTIIDIDHDRDMVRSLVEMGEQGGYLPIYPVWNSYTSEMDGDHAVAIIGDAYLKGIGGFDPAEAYQLMRRNALETPSIDLYRDGRGRRALESYLKYGFIPLEDPVQDAYHKKEQVSRTLDYAYDDFVISEVARKLGKTEDAEIFRKRADNYKNVIDPKIGFTRGRHADGRWDSPFDPAKETYYLTEGTPYQYTFFVLEDIPGLIQWVGGRKVFLSKLDELFEKGYYEHGNEPSHHISYLYNYAGEAWKTQERVQKILKTYKDCTDGLPGNDDAGQMSAWYVLSALGLYQVTPGIPQFEVTSPHFDNIVLHLPNGRKLRITAPGATKGAHFIQAATLNGKPLQVASVQYSDIMAGGELVFHLSTTPNKSWPMPLEKIP